MNCMYFKIVTACSFKILLKQTVNQALKFEIFFKPIFKQSCLYACKCNYKLFFSIFFLNQTQQPLNMKVILTKRRRHQNRREKILDDF